MKLGQVFELIFRSQHNHSEFSHFCLFVFLLFLFFTYMQGFKNQLDEKVAYQKRIKSDNQRRLQRQQAVVVNAAPSLLQTSTSAPQETIDAPAKLAVAKGQPIVSSKESMQFSKAQIVEQLLAEEQNLEGFRLIKDKPESNAFVLHKDDVENPIFRIDMLIEKVTPRQVFEVLRDQATVTSWFGKTLQSKIILSDSQDKVYSTIHKGGVFPLKNREIIHKHITQADESSHTYVVSYTTQGLENTPSKQKSKYARAYQSLFGLVIRGGLFNEKGEPIASKVFFIGQMEFAGQYVSVNDQVKSVPHFMLEYAEKMVERAMKVK